MRFEYFATNEILTPSKTEVNYYLELLYQYFAFTRITIMPKHFAEEHEKAMQKLNKICEAGCNTSRVFGLFKEIVKKPDASLNKFKVRYFGHTGFYEEIVYEDGNFKLRLFYLDELEKSKNMGVLFEPMRASLESGPKKFGLTVKKIDEGLNAREFDGSFEDYREIYRKQLEDEIKDEEEIANQELPELEKFEGGFDEWLFEQDLIDRAKGKLGRLKIKRKLLDDQGWKRELKKTTKLFKAVSEDFYSKFKKQEFLNIAYGTFPYTHKIDGAIARIAEPRVYLPDQNYKEFSLLDAEIYHKPENCQYIISINPYCSVFPELNEWHVAEFLKDEDLMKGLIAHELAHLIFKKKEQVKINQLKYMVDPYYKESVLKQKEKQLLAEHKKINGLLGKIGYKEETVKLQKWYLKKYTTLSKKAEPVSRESALLEDLIRQCKDELALLS